jgi:hypothetical protein
VKVFVVWEPILATDLTSPSTRILGKIADGRAQQFWDKGRLLSKAMGEKDEDSAIWDYIAVFDAGQTWQDSLPEPKVKGEPVIDVIAPVRQALTPQTAAIMGR